MLEFKRNMSSPREVISVDCCDVETAEPLVIKHYKKHKGKDGYYYLFNNHNRSIVTGWTVIFKELFRDGRLVADDYAVKLEKGRCDYGE